MLAGWVGVVAFQAWPAPAHETDNFYLPLDVEMADLGDFLEAVHTLALEETVAEVNAQIERALASQNPATRARRLAHWHEPEAVARVFHGRFSVAAAETRVVEQAVSGDWARRVHPGQATRHFGIWMNLAGHFPLDPRLIMKLSQCATIKAYGVYFGTDKLTHFHHLGWHYYAKYRALLADGLSPAEAYRKVLKRYTDGGLNGEALCFGTWSTGVYSNADMAVNHLGFKFLLNLTEPITLQGKPREPLLARCGVFWHLNHHVRLRSGWLRPFISDHWNEALNPSLYDWTMRAGIRRVLRGRAEAIVQFYTQTDGRPGEAAYFERLAHELSTCHGEPYGHSGRFEKLMTIGNTCLPALQGKEAGASP